MKKDRILTLAAAVILLAAASPLAWALLNYAFALTVGWMARSDIHEVRVLAWYALGLAPHCSVSQVRKGLAVEKKIDALVERIAKTNRLVAREGEMELWETEQGQFWTDGGQDRKTFALLLAEEAIELYGDVRPGDIVLDCGSHWGLFTRKALARGARFVVAIDPAPAAMACFRRTFSNEITEGRVIPVEKGVWDKDDNLTLLVDRGRTWQNSLVLTRERVSGPKVHLTTIDSIVSELKLPRVDFVKMDVEGSERQALAGASESIRRFRPILSVCLYHLRDDPVVIPDVVRKIYNGYEFYSDCCREYAGYRPYVGYFKKKI